MADWRVANNFADLGCKTDLRDGGAPRHLWGPQAQIKHRMKSQPDDLQTILMVDHDPHTLRLLTGLLHGIYALRAANSAERALRAAILEPPVQLILLGLDASLLSEAPVLLDALRAHPATHQTPVVVLCDPELPTDSLNSAARLEKPVHAASLRACLHQLLPASRPETARAQGPTMPPLAGRRALVTDDDPMLRQALADVLERVNIGVAQASSGPQALEALQRERFDWVLLDVQMPGMDGLETTRRIRANPRQADVCIIAVTGNDSHADQEAAKAAGMNSVLVKPIETAHLYRILAQWLDQSPPPEHPGSEPTSPFGALMDFDPRRIEELAQKDPQRLRKYARHFIDNLSGGLSELENAAASQDWPALARHAHRVKSQARWAGALRLGEHLAELEKTATDAAPDLTLKRVAALHAVFTVVELKLSRFLA